MARRRQKKRTHVGAADGKPLTATNGAGHKNPKSMVIRMGAGDVGPSVSQLAKDVRLMMEPDTASRLKERKSNKLRDYTTMTGPLGVSHLLLFSRSSSGNVNLRIALTPRGPTLHFRVDKYSLCKDVKKAMRHPKGGKLYYRAPPLLIMNNFTSQPSSDSSTPSRIPKHLESLSTAVFQSLFPAISPQSTPLSSIRRVLLLNRESPNPLSADDGSYVLSLRHYAITTRATGLSKPMRRLNATEKMMRSRHNPADGTPSHRRGPALNLNKLEDVADYFLEPGGGAAIGYGSGTESEIETDAEVEVLETNARKVLSRQQREKKQSSQHSSAPHESGVEKRAVKLVELGPRMRLRLTKVEEGVCAGKIMWHEFIKKSKGEEAALDQVWEQRNKEREERKRIQKENVKRKRGEKSKDSSKEAENGDDDEELDDDDDNWDDELDEDEEEDELGGVETGAEDMAVEES